MKTRRLERNLSQTALAEALTEAGLPMDAPRISRIESGQVIPRFPAMLVICDVLDFTPNDISAAAVDDSPATPPPSRNQPIMREQGPSTDLGLRIARLRVKAGWSQARLGKAMRNAGHKWSQAAVSNVELGDRSLQLLEAADLAELLNVSIGVLAGIESEPLPPAPDHKADVHRILAALTAPAAAAA